MFKRRERRRRIIDAIVKPCLPFSLLSLSLGFWLSLSLSLLIPFYLSHPSQWLTTTTTSPWQISLPVRISFLSHLILFFFFLSSFFSIIFFYFPLCSPQWRESRRPSQCSQGISIPEIRKFSFFFLFLSVWRMIGFFCVRCWNTSFMVGFRCLGNWLIYLFIFSI